MAPAAMPPAGVPATAAPGSVAATPAPVPVPVTNTEAMPATREEKLPPINVGAWLRIGGRVQGTTDPKKLNDQSMDSIYGELHAGGKIHKNVSVTLNLNANGTHGTAGIEDAIIGFDFVDAFHVWVGQLLVPVDRANAAGPFFMIPWNYPGVMTVGGVTKLALPREGGSGRNTGAVFWGDFDGGTFKYLLGAFDNGDAKTSPLFSGRLNLSLLSKEAGFWGNATYFGDKDIVAFGVGAQYQKNGSTTAAIPATATTPAVAAQAADYSEVNADALAEFKIGGGGWVTGEAAYYHFAGDYEAVKNGFFITAAVASPVVGVGNIQPMFRYQMYTGDNDLKWSTIDAFVSYLVKGPALRATVGYERTDFGNDVVGNSIQLGAQAIFF